MSAEGLDPEARELIAAFEANPPPSPATVPVEEYRRAAYDSLRLAAEPARPTLAKDVTVPGRDGDLPARRYRPTGEEHSPIASAGAQSDRRSGEHRTEDLTRASTAARIQGGSEGLLLYFHGGGFVRGDLDTHDPLCRALAGAGGCTVVSVAYRRAPEHPFPAAVEDAIAATAWATAGSAGPVAVGGDSSGGNLAAVAALATRDGGGTPLAAQLLLYPVTDATMSAPSLDELAEGRMLTRAAMEWFYDQYLPDRALRRDPRASPLLAPRHDELAPAIVVTAGQDPVRDDGERYAAKLEAAGTPVRHLRYEGTIHSFMLYAGALRKGRDAIEAVGAELRRALRKGPNSALK